MSDVWPRDWEDEYPPVPKAQARTAHFYKIHPLSNPAKVRSFLHQDKFWVNAQLERLKIKEMEADHLAATMAFLLDRALKVFFFEDLRAEVREMPVDWIEDPRIRMMATPLFIAMKKRYMKIMQDGETKRVATINVQD